MAKTGDTIQDFRGETYEVVRVEPNHIRRAPDYVCRDVKGFLVYVPAGNVRGEDMAARRERHELDEKHLLIQLRSIRRSFIAEWRKPWPGAEFGKALVGQAIDGAIHDVEVRSTPNPKDKE